MRIDAHAHLWSQHYLEQLDGGGVPTQAQRGLGAGASDEELAARFAQMDAAGVDAQILSATPFSPRLPAEAAAVRAAPGRTHGDPSGNRETPRGRRATGPACAPVRCRTATGATGRT